MSRRIVACAAVAVLLGCGGGGDTPDGGADATLDSPSDAISDAPQDAGSDAAAGFHDMSDTSLWEAFDLTTFNPAFAHLTGFFGGTFDGRYVYLTPYQRGVDGDASASVASGLVVRYDTQAPFGSVASWSSFDVASVDPNALAFMSSVFDGRYVTFMPGPIRPMAARYDTQAPFDAPASWTTFQLANDARWGAAFDGRYVYSPAAEDNRVARYDTQAAFAADAGWTSFDATQLVPAPPAYPKAWVSALFDGRYVYFGPGTASAANGLMGRYDTQAPFASASSWTSFDTSAVAPTATVTAGMTFDGRYVYFAPYYASGVPSDVVARYDTQAPLDAGTAWSTVDISPLAGPDICIGAVFDGRYVYLVPWQSGEIERYDTTAPFGDLASWSHFDGKSIHPNAQAFRGGVFDGRHVYFVPSELSVVLRFDARSPAAMPPSHHGSFF